MSDDTIGAALAEWTGGLDPVAARVACFARVRDLPYRYPSSRDPLVVLGDRAGSCSGKHYLLGELYRRLGLPVRNMICSHRFNDSPLPFPEHMQALLDRNEVMDWHDYLQVNVNGSWIDIDATWPLGLRDFGLPANDDWDGTSSMSLSVVPDEHEELRGDLGKGKEERLSRLTPRQRGWRKEFLESLSQWAAELQAEVAEKD
ncbi:MAG: transglutaminase domain-containing protein [bacterium]